MPERTRGVPPGTFLIVGLIAAGIAVALWRRAVSLPAPGGGPVPAPVRPAWPDMRIDVNTATAPQLNVLPGIGPALAERIVADRSARGPFADPADLDRVHGIGPATVEGVRGFVVVERK